MNYTNFENLIADYKNKKINRAQFCADLSQMQGFDGEVKATGTKKLGLMFHYRGREIKLANDRLVWVEGNKILHADSIKTAKIKIDITELNARDYFADAITFAKKADDAYARADFVKYREYMRESNYAACRSCRCARG